jgi:hypothetical protein
MVEFISFLKEQLKSVKEKIQKGGNGDGTTHSCQ